MKSFYWSLAAIISITTLLAGCGGDNNAQSKSTPQAGGKSTLTWLTWGSADPLNQLNNSIFETFPDLKEKYGFQIEIGGSNSTAVAQKFRLALAAKGDVPDIMQLNYLEIPEFAEAGVLEDLTGHMKSYSSNLTDGANMISQYKGKYIAFPYQVKPKIWLYRKDMFDAAGIDPSKIKNTNDLIAAGKKLQEKYPKSYIIDSGSPVDSGMIGGVLSGNGSRFVDDKGNYIVDTDPGVRKTFEVFRQLKDSGIGLKVTSFTPDFQKAIADSTLASWLVFDWAKPYLSQWVPDQSGKWEAAEWPVLGDAVGGSDLGGGVWVIPAAAKHKKEAIDYLTKLVLTKEGNVTLHKSRGIIPSLKETFNDPQLKKPDPYFGANLAVVENKVINNDYKIFPFNPSSVKEREIVYDYVNKYAHGELSLDDALKRAQADLKNQIGNPLKK